MPIAEYINWKQTSDVTELSTCCFAPQPNRYNNSFLSIDEMKELVDSEFAWAVSVMDHNPERHQVMKDFGFRPVSSMNNWYHGHSYEKRKLTFWWGRVHPDNSQSKREHKRATWGGMLTDGNDKYLSCSGCGFAFCDHNDIGKDFEYTFAKYFSLVRLTLEDHHSGRHKERLERCNFRLLDIGSESAFYVNGWDPDTYSVDEDVEFCKSLGDKPVEKPPQEAILAPIVTQINEKDLDAQAAKFFNKDYLEKAFANVNFRFGDSNRMARQHIPNRLAVPKPKRPRIASADPKRRVRKPDSK